MPKSLSKAGRKPKEFIDDDGCQYAPRCEACPWRECVWTLSADERKVFTLAYRTLAAFKAAPDRTIPT